LRMQGEWPVGALKLPAAMAEISAPYTVNSSKIPNPD